MADTPLAPVVRYIHQLVGRPEVADPTDADLLRQFVCQRNEDAFATLVRRHGPLVWRVCRRLLRHTHHAEEAYQATFLVLARQAAKVRKPASLASFLYGVAYRIARKMKADIVRRQSHEKELIVLPVVDPACEAAWLELEGIVVEEVHALAEKYRLPILLCYWQGLTNEEAAVRLGWPAGTVKTRLLKARRLLHERLTQRGVSLSAGVFATLLAAGGGEAAVPLDLASSAMRMGMAFMRGDSLPAAGATALAEQAVQGVALSKVHIVLVLLLASGIATAVGALAHHEAPARQAEEARAARANPKTKEEEKPKLRTDRYGDPLPPGAIARIGTVRLRHGESALRVIFSPDGKTLASSGLDGTFRRWDAATGKELWCFKEFSGNIAYSPDGRTFAGGGSQIGGGGGPIRLWDSATGREIRQFKGGVFAFSPDGKTLAVSISRNSIQLYDVSTGQAIRQPLRGHQNPIRALCFSADGKKLVSIGDRDKTIHVWNAATGEELRQLQGHEDAVSSVALSPDGKVLASGSNDKTIRLWDMASGKERQRLEQPGSVFAVAFSHDGKTLATGCSNSGYGILQLWDAAVEMKPRRRISLPDPVVSIAFAPDDRTLASAQGMSIRLWNTATGEEIPRGEDHSAQTYSLAVSADGRTVAVGSKDDAIRLCDIATSRVIRRLPLDPDVPATDVVAFSADGKTLVSSATGVAKRKMIPKGFDLWNLATGERVRRVPGVLVYPLALSPDGKTVAAGVVGKIVLFDTASGKELRRLPGWADNGNALAFSPDSKQLASINPGKAALWDVATDKEIHTFPGQQTGALAFSPDRKLLATTKYERGKGGIVYLWDVATGTELRRLRQPNGSFQVVAFSPDGRSVATGDHQYREHIVHLWETATGKMRHEWKGHDGRIWSLAFSPDGKRLLSGGFDTSVLVWDVMGHQSTTRPMGLVTSEHLLGLWKDLASEDAAKAFAAIGQLSASAKQAVPLLKDKLRPVPAVADPRQVARLIADLDSDSFAVRQKAQEELRRLGEYAEPALRQALRAKLTLEARKRVQELLAEVRVSPEGLRELRAVEVLEYLGATDAQQVLEPLAKGAPEARLTREAKASLERLAKRRTVQP